MRNLCLILAIVSMLCVFGGDSRVRQVRSMCGLCRDILSHPQLFPATWCQNLGVLSFRSIWDGEWQGGYHFWRSQISIHSQRISTWSLDLNMNACSLLSLIDALFATLFVAQTCCLRHFTGNLRPKILRVLWRALQMQLGDRTSTQELPYFRDAYFDLEFQIFNM